MSVRMSVDRIFFEVPPFVVVEDRPAFDLDPELGRGDAVACCAEVGLLPTVVAAADVVLAQEVLGALAVLTDEDLDCLG